MVTKRTTIAEWPKDASREVVTLCIAQFPITWRALRGLKPCDLLVPKQALPFPTITLYEGTRLRGKGQLFYIGDTGYAIRVTHLA